MEKRYNFRIYPTAEQKTQMQKNFDCCRFVYNYYLNKRIEHHKNGGEILSWAECCRDLTKLKKSEGYEWLCEADCNSLQSTLKNLDLAFRAFFRNVKRGGAPGFPKFKSKRDTYKSYKSTRACSTPSVDISERQIKLPKVGWVNCKVSRKVEGRILSASVIQVPSGKYYVSVCCTDVVPVPLPLTGNKIGLHLGITNFGVTSDGQTFENNRFIEKSAKKVTHLQRKLTRQLSGSKNYEKTRVKLTKAYEHITNQRTDASQKLSTQLVREYDTICVKKLQIAKNTKLGHRFFTLVKDASWGMFVQQLSYKCDWYGRQFVLVDTFFPYVQICSSCGFKNEEAGKKSYIKEWVCPKCGVKHNRGINAAKNILRAGIGELVCLEQKSETA
jgi:putative transposase